VVSPVVFGWMLDVFSREPRAWGAAWMMLGIGAFGGPLATWRLSRMKP
jgi:hypothetical protein